MKPTFHSRAFLGAFPCFLDTGNWFGRDWRCKREQTSPQNSWLECSHLEKIPTFSVAADADTAGRKHIPSSTRNREWAEYEQPDPSAGPQPGHYPSYPEPSPRLSFSLWMMKTCHQRPYPAKPASVIVCDIDSRLCLHGGRTTDSARRLVGSRLRLCDSREHDVAVGGSRRQCIA